MRRVVERPICDDERHAAIMSDMADDVRLDYEDLASRVCELVSRPAWTEEQQMRRCSRRQAGEDGKSSSPPLGRVYTVSSLDSISSVDDDSQFSLDFEGARLAARDVLARVDCARLYRHERNGFRGGSGVFLVLFGVVLGILMSVSFGDPMRRWESSASKHNVSLPGSSFVGRGRDRLVGPGSRHHLYVHGKERSYQT